jgi:hypothetical protein
LKARASRLSSLRQTETNSALVAGALVPRVDQPPIREKIMREMVLPGAAAALLAFGGAGADAMGGSGNLSPEASPYAILEPQTLAPAAPVMASESPTSVVHRAPGRHVRIAPGVRKTP